MSARRLRDVLGVAASRGPFRARWCTHDDVITWPLKTWPNRQHPETTARYHPCRRAGLPRWWMNHEVCLSKCVTSARRPRVNLSVRPRGQERHASELMNVFFYVRRQRTSVRACLFRPVRSRPVNSRFSRDFWILLPIFRMEIFKERKIVLNYL